MGICGIDAACGLNAPDEISVSMYVSVAPHCGHSGAGGRSVASGLIGRCYNRMFLTLRPRRPEAQDVALSRLKHGFESRRGRQPSLGAMLARASAGQASLRAKADPDEAKPECVLREGGPFKQSTSLRAILLELRSGQCLPELRLGKPACRRSLIPPKRRQVFRVAKADGPRRFSNPVRDLFRRSAERKGERRTSPAEFGWASHCSEHLT